MPRIILISQARMGSSRLPGKVMNKVLGRTLLDLFCERLRRMKYPDEIVIATSTEEEDDAIVSECENIEVSVFRGSFNNVLERYYACAKAYHADIVVRITSDCPLIDPQLSDELIDYFLAHQPLDFVYNNWSQKLPHGLDTEVFSFEALEKSYREAKELEDLEHVSRFMRLHPKVFKVGEAPIFADGFGRERWTVDYPEDFELVRKVYEALYPKNKNFNWKDIIAYLNTHPEIRSLNQKWSRKPTS